MARRAPIGRLDYIEPHLLEPFQAVPRPHAHVVRRNKGDTFHSLFFQEMPHRAPREIAKGQIEERVALFFFQRAGNVVQRVFPPHRNREPRAGKQGKEFAYIEHQHGRNDGTEVFATVLQPNPVSGGI